MMLERRTRQGMLRLPNNRDCVDGQEKTSPRRCDKQDKGPVATTSNNNERKTCKEEAGETNHEPTEVTKTEAANASALSAKEKRSPLTAHGLGELTYNPITHVPSMRTYSFFIYIFSFFVVFLSKKFSNMVYCLKIKLVSFTNFLLAWCLHLYIFYRVYHHIVSGRKLKFFFATIR